ncbi:MAG: hypothetical protein V7605_2535 [Acidimicrobiaceae bacterium]|jgi:hypothetical protein
MGEPGRRRTAAEWWRGLPGAWRANVSLYCLATIALIALVTQVLTGRGGPPQRLEVASRAPVTTTTSPRFQTTTTTGPPTTGAPDTTAAPVTTVAPPPPAKGPNTPPAPAPLQVQPQDTTTAPPVCRNSTDPRCGDFSWSPEPAQNQPLTVTATASTSGSDVTFTVRVIDPDHSVTGNCAQVDIGDGPSQPFGCTPPQCVNAHGPWTPPAQVTGDQTFTFHHAVENYRATFTFRTDQDVPCPNPYGSMNTGSVDVTVPAAPGP